MVMVSNEIVAVAVVRILRLRCCDALNLSIELENEPLYFRADGLDLVRCFDG